MGEKEESIRKNPQDSWRGRNSDKIYLQGAFQLKNHEGELLEGKQTSLSPRSTQFCNTFGFISIWVWWLPLSSMSSYNKWETDTEEDDFIEQNIWHCPQGTKSFIYVPREECT